MMTRHRPQYHFLPPANWMNDPNGLIQWKETYHLFYQYNPAGPVHGDIHWGHATSADLVHWTHLPIALAPTPGGADAGGCWSGCAVDFNGVPAFLYTGFEFGAQRTCLAFGDEKLTQLEKYPGNPVIAAPPEGLNVIGFRDHSVWKESGIWNQVIGSGELEKGGMVLRYRSSDLVNWEYQGPLLKRDECSDLGLDLGQMWECPSFFALGDRHVLVLSVWDNFQLHYAVSLVGDFDGRHFTPINARKLDFGNRCYYAPQTMLDEKGRRLVWGWLMEGRPVEAQIAAGWSGVMSLPRQLWLDEQARLRQRFVPELSALRGEMIHLQDVELASGETRLLTQVRGRALEISLEMDEQDSGKVGLMLLRSQNGEEETRLYVDWDTHQLVMDRSRSSLDKGVEKTLRSGEIDALEDERVRLHIYLDHSAIEVIANDRASLSTRVYPTREDSLGLGLFAQECPAHISVLDSWVLKSIWT